MTWDDHQTSGLAPAPSGNEPASVRRPDGLRRALLTAGIAGALLVTGGVAVAFAASPEPSGSPAPSATTTDPSSGSTTSPTQGRQGHGGQPCPDDSGSGSNGSGGSSGSDDSGRTVRSAQPEYRGAGYLVRPGCAGWSRRSATRRRVVTYRARRQDLVDPVEDGEEAGDRA